MPERVGATFAPGNGRLGPFANFTSRTVAVTITGAPWLLSEIAPTQSVLSVVKVSVVNRMSESGGAALNSGDSKRTKCRSGTASSPGCGLIAARSRRYSGTRTSTLRRKLVRVAAAVVSPDWAAVSSAVTWARTSSGHDDERATIFVTDVFRVAASPRFAAMRHNSTRAARLSGWAARIF